MALSEFAAVAVFVAVALFGIVDAIGTPIKIKCFYTGRGFANHAEKKLSECTDARIVDAMYTERCFTEGTVGTSQMKAWSVDRKKFTISKATRKRNRTPWSVTIVEGNFASATCLMLPTVVPEAIAYVGNGQNIEFEEDLEIANRYHIVTENEAAIRSMISGEVREFLLQPHIVFIEITDTQIVMRRNWADHLVLDRLAKELDISKKIQDRIKHHSD